MKGEVYRRPPGQSNMEKVLDYWDEMNLWLFMSAMVSYGMFVSLLVLHGWAIYLVSVLYYVGLIWLGWYLRKQGKLLASYRQGMQGERFVGQQLMEQLLPEGFKVFHDLDFGTFNIDHVVVGPNGVFAIETKTWSKRASSARMTCKSGALFKENGQAILGGPDAIEEAKRHAEALERFLSSRLKRPFTVKAVLALPGYFTDNKEPGSIGIINSKNCLPYFKQTRLQPLPEDLRNEVEIVLAPKTEIRLE